jgi:ligand-binding SRPBCC domain-containing protein
MPTHTLHSRQTIRASLDVAWLFFSNPRNLEKITPPDMGFTIVTKDLPNAIYPGMMIEYRVKPLLCLPMSWLTEITHVEKGSYFVDEQRVGPYAIWHHEHRFRDLGDGRIELEDRVTYRLPFQPVSELIHPLLVKPQLQRIFAHREQAVARLFPL